MVGLARPLGRIEKEVKELQRDLEVLNLRADPIMRTETSDFS